MLMEVKKQFKITGMTIKYNIMREMLNVITFTTNIIFMILNNASFIVQWVILLNIKDSIGGYKIDDILLLWGISSFGYGIAHLLFNGAFDLPKLIVNGKLDSFLVQPRNVLMSVITSRTAISAIGDIIYGLIILVIVRPSIYSSLLYILFSITGAIIMTAVAIIFGSLSFWLGRSETISNNINNLMTNFSTYPDTIFKTGVKILLYTLIPVGLTAYLPIRIIMLFNINYFIIVIMATIMITIIAFMIFNSGLRKYSSSNLMTARI